jgi:hypothetical protein
MIAAVAPHAANAAELQQGLAGLKKCFNVTSTGDLTPWGLDEKVMLTQTNMVNDGKQLELKSIGSYETYMPQAEDMRAMFNQPVFGWINPYLCI